MKKKANSTPSQPQQKASDGKLYRVQVEAFANRENADSLLTRIKNAGYDAYVKREGNLYKVQVGAFSNKQNADRLAAELKKKGYDVYITN